MTFSDGVLTIIKSIDKIVNMQVLFEVRQVKGHINIICSFLDFHSEENEYRLCEWEPGYVG
jgi:hypothetical protein